jgi:hypothetical protein
VSCHGVLNKTSQSVLLLYVRYSGSQSTRWKQETCRVLCLIFLNCAWSCPFSIYHGLLCFIYCWVLITFWYILTLLCLKSEYFPFETIISRIVLWLCQCEACCFDHRHLISVVCLRDKAESFKIAELRAILHRQNQLKTGQLWKP